MPRLSFACVTPCAMVFLAACGRRDAAPPRETAAVVPFQVPAARPGRLTVEGDALRFVACGEGGPGVLLSDTPDSAVASGLRALGAGPGGATVLLRLLGGQALSLRYAALEGLPCTGLPVAAVVEARGTEPFWSLSVERTGPTFRTAAAPEGTGYPPGSWSRPDPAHWRYRAAWTGDTGADSLRLDLAEAPCTDAMSGARYAFRATLVLGGRALTGCGVEGREGMGAPVGAQPLPVASLEGTVWHLTRINGEAAVPGPQLIFRPGGRVVGAGYCNRFLGPAKVEGTAVQLGPLVVSRKPCADADGARSEATFFHALGQAERLGADGTALLVYVRGMQEPLRFEPAAP